MNIKIFEKFRPFSHQAGTVILLANSPFSFTIFPTRIIVRNLRSDPSKILCTLTHNLLGPIEKFLIISDLERDTLFIEGFANSIYFKSAIFSNGDDFAIKSIKGNVVWSGYSNPNDNPITKEASLERLHLGCSKKLDWILLKRRLCMKEILPLWFFLGQKIQHIPSLAGDSLLTQCKIAIQEKNKNSIINDFKNLFLAGFEDIFSPRLQDEEYQGYPLPPVVSESPLTLLTEGAQLIRQLFFQNNFDKEFDILPLLPPELFCGKMLGIHCGDFGVIDIEWTKKIIRRMIFRPKIDCELLFNFQKKVKTYRLTVKNQKKSYKLTPLSTFNFENCETYYFDNFES